MCSTQEDTNSRHKLAQLWHVARDEAFLYSSYIDPIKRVVNEILTPEVDINKKVTINAKSLTIAKHLKDCTALHFVYYRPRNLKLFRILLERGADFTVKNANGQTPLHLIITQYRDSYCGDQPKGSPYTDAVLSAQVKSQNPVNPHDNDGVSHLHAACFANNVEALELFLDNGASVDEAVDIDAQNSFAGFSPLHFAAKFHSYDVALILVRRGANANAKNAKGMTPLDLLVKYNVDYLNCSLPADDETACQKNYLINEKIMKLMLENGGASNVGLSSFHVACILKDLKIAESLLDQVTDVNQAVSMESSIYPGVTALHFGAASSLEAVKMLLKRGGNMDIEDLTSVSPLKMCLNRYDIQSICKVLSSDETWNTVYMTDGKTRLLDIVSFMENLDRFKLFVRDNIKSLAVPSDSLILPGCTVLHLAVIFSKRVKGQDRWQISDDDSIVKECLEKNLDINAQNARGQSPIHLAFRLGKENIVRLLLERLDGVDEVTNLADEDNLSYLHVACAQQVESLVEKLLRSSNPNISYNGKSISVGRIDVGSTPLHVATAYQSTTIANMLLTNGADLHANDANGMTPIHCVLKLPPYGALPIADVLFNALLEKLEDRVVENVGLNYLHVASFAGHVNAVKALLDHGSDIHAVYSYENFSNACHWNRWLMLLADYSRYTPLHLSQFRHVVEVVDLLVRRGADVFAKVTKRHINKPFWHFSLDNMDTTRSFVAALWDQSERQKYVEKELGLTKLHVACHMKNEEAIRSVLKDGIDVNAKVHADSKIFPGCTPLHLLLTVSHWRSNNNQNQYDIESKIKLLLEYGADVTALDAKKNTPIHLFYDQRYHFTNRDHCKDLLLNGHLDFSVNPVDAEGLTHFHLACRWHNVEIVEKFLQHGSVDVNQPTDCFATYDAGSTPLHLTLNSWMRPDDDWTKLLQTVDLLLKHGADVDARDVLGDTPLHTKNVLLSPELSVLDKLVSYGADVRSKNFKGETLFDRWSGANVIDYAKVLNKYNYPMISWNSLTGEGYIGKRFLSARTDITGTVECKNLIQSPEVRTIDELGRTIIHNCVAILPSAHVAVINYVYVFENFIKQDINIDHQDQLGQTALHYAARMENRSGVIALLKCGADINITDNNGKSAFSYVTEYNGHDSLLSFFKGVIEAFDLHVKKMQLLRVKVSQLNKNISAGLQPMRYTRLDDYEVHRGEESRVLQPFFSQVEVANTMDIGVGALTLFDFLNETVGVTLYPYLSIDERTTVDEFFISTATREQFGELIGIMKLQYKKMKKRFELIDSALVSLRKILGFSVSGLCEEIARFLTNSDLINVIACIVDIEDEEMMQLRKRVKKS